MIAFVEVAGVGAAVGGVVGFVASHAIRRVDDAMVEVMLTIIAAYGSFAIAEELGVSGVIATVVAGMVCGDWAARRGMSDATRLVVGTFWEVVAFALNSVVFLLIGLEVHPRALLAAAWPIAVAYLAMTAARFVLVFGVLALLGRTSETMPWRWGAILGLSGLRGALSMVLALSLAHSFPFRELIIEMTYGVVLLSIVVQGLTMRPLLGLLHRDGRT